jgi:predicted transglutaminase-like cysteine proteinase
MWTAGPARVLARAAAIAFAVSSFQPALAGPIEPAALGPPSLGPDRRVELEARRDPVTIRLTALDPVPRKSIESPALAAEPYGRIALPAAEGALWRKWRQVEREIKIEAEVLARCRADPAGCPSAARRFLAIINAGKAREGRARFGEINRAINLSIRPMSDLAQYGVPDLWTAPLATLGAGAGDCEDYAIAKYVALREAGVDDRDLRLLIVRDKKLRRTHAVVAARLDDRWLVLDNRRFELLEDVQLAEYLPMFEIDQEGVKRLIAREVVQGLLGLEPTAPSAGADPAPGANWPAGRVERGETQR